ncbi:MAG: TetR/AcrR family transcriptional regulator [Pseudomonadota bacterium]
MAKPPSRPGGKRERTRNALIEAALAVAEEKGFLAASLDEVAARAGMSKGAIYSNFRSKTELMAAAAERRSLRLAPDYEPGAPLKAQLCAIARAVAGLLPKARGLERLNAEFQIYVLAEPELRAQVAAHTSALLDAGAEVLARQYGDRLAMLPRHLAVTIQSLSLGFIYQHQITPEEVTEDVIVAAFEALAEGAAQRADEQTARGP